MTPGQRLIVLAVGIVVLGASIGLIVFMWALIFKASQC